MLSYIKTTCLFILLAIASFPVWAQNTQLTGSTTLPGGSDNVLIGPANTYSGSFTGIQNIAIGKSTGQNLTSGRDNIVIGSEAGLNKSTGRWNVMLGHQAGKGATNGYDNVLAGNLAGEFTTTGRFNVMIGSMAGQNNATGDFNSLFGYQAGNNNSVSNNAYLGAFAGSANVSGTSNAFLGYNAGLNALGQTNTFAGAYSGYRTTTGSTNTFLGNSAGENNSSGASNTFLGYKAGSGSITAHENCFFGESAGDKIITGSQNTYLGPSANSIGSNAASLIGTTALGYNATVAVHDALVLGDPLNPNVKVGIGTAYPNQKLTIRGNINFLAYDNSIRLKNRTLLHWDERENLALGLGSEIAPEAERNLTLGSARTRVLIPGSKHSSGLVLAQYVSTQLPGQVLTVDERGKVKMASPRIQVATASDWSLGVFAEGYALRPLSEVARFVRLNGHLPDFPSAATMASEGIPLTALLAAQTRKLEELTLYMVALSKQSEGVESKLDALAEIRRQAVALQAEVQQSK